MTTTDLISIITAVAATIGAFATWNAARQARESAKIARESMESASEMARKNLDETTRYNRRSAFENRYGLLLAQHDLYHNQLCEYIDKQKSEASSTLNTPIGHFFEHNYTSGSMGFSLSFLTGHQIISRYMRTLYHLLKFIKNEFYIDTGNDITIAREMKNYVSPVRSTIRNDILCLIAVNALNIENKNAESTGYINYQELLHFFDFFEHAVFHSPFHPNKVFEDENEPTSIHDLILKQSRYESWFENNENAVSSFKLRDIQIFSPVIACLIIYENPMKSAAIDAITNVYNKISNTLQNNLNFLLNDYYDNIDIISDFKKGEYQKTSNTPRIETTQELINEITSSLQVCNSAQYKTYRFYVKENPSVSRNPMSGHHLMVSIEHILYYKEICEEINLAGDVESFIRNKKSEYKNNLPSTYNQINIYSSFRE